MANVYSIKIWQETFATGIIPGPTVPVGFVWVVRNITVRTGAVPFAETGLVEFWIGGVGEFPLAGWSQDELRGSQWVSWDGHQVLNAGEVITCQANSPGAAWMISGYQLSLP